METECANRYVIDQTDCLKLCLLLISAAGVAHEMEADDVYKGCFFEKGTRILPLDWYEMVKFVLG